MRAMIAAVLSLALTQSAVALTFEARKTEAGLPFLVVKGMFDFEGQVSAFTRAVAKHDPEFITFDSIGGNVMSAMEIGRMIRSLGLSTIQRREMHCMSACSLAFVGGIKRLAEPGSIGVHRSYYEPSSTLTRDEAVTDMQTVTAEVIDYLSDMGVDSGLLAISLRYSQSDIRYLSGSEMSQLGITTTDREEAVVTPPPAQEPPPDNDVMAAQAAEFVKAVIYYHQLSASEAIRNISFAYAPWVSYFDRSIVVRDVLADKLDYFKRWPYRSYHIKLPTVSTHCYVASLCEVRGIYSWAVRDEYSGQRRSGEASFTFGVDMARKLVVSEAGTVIDPTAVRATDASLLPSVRMPVPDPRPQP